MMLSEVVKKIINWWVLKPEPIEATPYDNLENIDVQKIEKKYSLKDEARRLGESGIPHENSKDLSGSESQVVGEIEIARKSYINFASRRLASINQDIIKCDVVSEVLEAQNLHEIFENEVDGFLTQKNSEIEKIRVEMNQRREEYEEFKQKNNLTRLPYQRTVGEKFFLVSILIFLVIIEAAINGALFQKGLEGGFFAGITMASIFALINVSVCFLIGKLLHNYINVNWFKKIIGYLGVIIGFLYCLSIALILAHFRTAIDRGSEDPFAISVNLIINNAFDFEGLMSYGLIIVTLFFGLIAYIDGLKFDDPYPGYSDIYKSLKYVSDDYEIEIKELSDELEMKRDKFKSDIDNTLLRAEKHLTIMQNKIVEKEHTFERIGAAFALAQIAANTLVRIFRDENLIYRKDDVYPEYFNLDPKLIDLNIPDFSVIVDKEKCLNLKKEVHELNENINSIKSKIESSFNERFDRLKPLRENFNG